MLPWIRSHRIHKTVAATFLAATVFVFLFGVQQAGAQADTFGLNPIDNTIALANSDIRIIVAKVIRAVLGLLGVISLGLILYAGFTIMTSQGNEDKVAEGKKILTNSVIGLVIILSSLGIVQFVLGKLQEAINPGTEQLGGGSPNFNTFAGSGALGDIVRDHYPTTKQRDVPRNTKIAVTFAEPIDPSTIIKNTNGTCWAADGKGTVAACSQANAKPYYGDCVDLNGDKAIDWATECDQLATTSVRIFQSANKTISPLPVYEAAAMANYEADGSVRLFVFKPLENLGDSAGNIWHTVELLSSIKKADGKGVFDALYYKRYAWEFETNTTIDYTPPSVDLSLTSPLPGETIPRNKIIQITFTEAVDPTMVQGVLNKNSLFTNVVFGDQKISGQWKITNGYRTIEFVPEQPCGLNSCGQQMYCLTIDCPADDPSCVKPLSTLARTAALLDEKQSNFIAHPFSGVMDMAGNALDSSADGKGDGKIEAPPEVKWRHQPPLPDNLKTIGEEERSPDNFWLDFKVKNVIDRQAPYVRQVTPGIDNEGVAHDVGVQTEFSRKMWLASVAAGIRLEEYPANSKGPDGQPMDTMGYSSAAISGLNGGTKLLIKGTREFGANGLDLYYFTSVSSSVMSDNQNCLYPGFGPVSPSKNAGPSPVCNIGYDADGTIISTSNCAPLQMNASQDTACVTTNGSVPVAQGTVQACLGQLRTPSISPQTPK